MKPGACALVWRQKYLSANAKELLGKKVVVLERVKSSSFGGYFITFDGGTLKPAIPPVEYTVRELNSDSDKVYCVQEKAMQQIPTEVEVGSWDECVWKPEGV